MAQITKRENGKYLARVRRKGVKKARTFTRKADAKAWAERLEARIDLKQHANAPVAFISDIIEQYLKEITPRKKSSKVEEYTLNKVSEALGRYTTENLKPDHIVTYIDKRLKQVKPSTIYKALGKFSHVIDTANSLWGYSIDNPVKVAKRILSTTQSLTIDEHRDRRLKEGELLKLAQDDTKISDVILFAVDTAMRRGEIVKIQPEDLDGRLLKIPDTKTGKARTIPLTIVALEIFEKYEGNFYNSGQTLSKHFKKRCDDLGIKDLVFHDLRHEATSKLFEKGLSTEEVMSITGHTDYKSLQRYTHIQPTNLLDKI